MQSFNRSAWILAGALAAAGTVRAQVPPTNDTSDGNANTGMGTGALGGPTDVNFGLNNTAAGAYALYANKRGGDDNTAVGAYALNLNTTGASNTALGAAALQFDTTGSYNTASGFFALYSNTTGIYNTGAGAYALNLNTTGTDNTAFGVAALQHNTTGADNTASGFQALLDNTTGAKNLADGADALSKNTVGNDNTAIGVAALGSNTSGSNNIGVGNHGGSGLTTGSNNIDIGNPGLAPDSGTIRIGTAGTNKTAYIAGIENAKVTGAAVYVTASGQLGVLASSERYKTAIAPLRAGTEKLERLRPVSFHLKSDPTGAVQYGLIAEEVEKVYPELVIRDAAGRIQGVRYDELAPLLLTEVQSLRQAVGRQRADYHALEQEVARIRQMNESLQAAVTQLRAAPERLAQR
jgi:hypothetical protein